VSGLTLGITYELSVEARNSVGFSDLAESITILHAIVPEQPVQPNTANSG
jgi:hypothetical protein